MSDDDKELVMVMIAGIALDRALAHQFSEAAAALETEGKAASASTLRERARFHRVKALELQGRLAGLDEECGRSLPGLFSAGCAM
ncbi:hypothetical protein [Methylobacterium oxalidis]|uniref:Uncharacterized protein n=1 Tax=Methylobacterium oxalidis TaxID=944322 RepID=A0A512J6M0_9HYPH|nr:hypothetical protein [Methylobacterium oxalidis]GEP05621.1 hypothetical protein MOX02_36590 [Methylobacterium oxalidis]GJE35490.1 hypothetical protein LDDCCGHA_5708 [Methylobacterium oxalidis]GLS65399.1 hypothetical protein GCM10007888_37810 [Methylobacterium oxalidis]